MTESLIIPVLLSLGLAALTTLVLLLLGAYLAYLLYFQKGAAGVLIRVLINLPLVLPPTVLGFYFLTLFSPSRGFGAFMDQLGLSLNFSFAGLVVASVIFSLPFMINPILAALEGLPSDYTDVGLIYRRPKPYVFRRLLIPHVQGGFLAGSVMAFAHTLGEFGIILMIGGNIPGKTRVASVEIYNLTMAMDYQQAHILAGIMVLLSMLILGLFFGFIRNNQPFRLW